MQPGFVSVQRASEISGKSPYTIRKWARVKDPVLFNSTITSRKEGREIHEDGFRQFLKDRFLKNATPGIREMAKRGRLL